MEKSEIKRRVIEILLKKKYAKIINIVSEFPVADRDNVIRAVMGDLRSVIAYDPEQGYRVKHRFGPKPQDRPEKPRFSEIPAHMAKVVGYPDDYTNPNVKNLAHLDQAEEGDCVGCSGASLSKLLRMGILKTPISPEESAIKATDVTLDGGVVVDVLPDDTVSASGVYYLARDKLKVKPADSEDGALITDGADVITHEGIVPEWMWPTGKTQEGQYVTPPAKYADLVKETLSKYKFDREGTDFVILDGVNGDPSIQIMDAVTTYGGCWMTMPVFDNYGAATPSGEFPDPIQGKSRIVGYHAVCLVGWTRTDGKRRWRFVNSWRGNTPLINTIGDELYMQPYFKTGYIQIIAILANAAVAFPARPEDPAPLPGPEPTPEPVPEPVPVKGFWKGLLDALVSFFRAMFGINTK
jgi:hypothetical protein